MEEQNRTAHTMQRIYFVVIIILLAILFGQRVYSRKQIPVPKGQWDKLYLVLDQIEKNYVDAIDARTIVEKSLPFIMEELDPHSLYLPPAELQQADEALAGRFDGIGVTFNVPNDTAVVSNVISGGPSERAGVLSGDRIVKV
ncbi:MAG: peptidase S41, partial [Bacteroidales bacterium]|nr:peptidase S41 [Bacteroidales bacterium]